MRVLWLTDSSGVSGGHKFNLQIILQQQGMKISDVYFVSLASKVGIQADIKTCKAALDDYISRVKPQMLVCCDEFSLKLFTAGNLFLCRGGVYEYSGQHGNLDCLVVDSPRNWVNMNINLKGKVRFNPGKWVLMNDVQKLSRWMKGKQRAQPRFNYSVARTRADLDRIKLLARHATAIGNDLETHPDKITVSGYSFLTQQGDIECWVIPFYNPFAEENCHWRTHEDELYAWETVRFVNSCEAPKFLHNGQYDCHYHVKFHVPLVNYIYDTMNMWHSIYTEAPKKINFMCSILLDFYRFWKDDAKGEDDVGGEHAGRFKSEEHLERYWRYNALDCYNCLCAGRVLLALLKHLDWARSNYVSEFELQVGPALACSMQGLRRSKKALFVKKLQLEEKYQKGLDEIRIMADDPEFNPNSPEEVKHLIYHTLGGKPLALTGKMKEKATKLSTDATVLKLIAEQHPILDMYVKKIIETKQPRNNISKYCEKRYPNDRLYFNLSAAGTETGRFASKKHAFRIGTQVQNVPSHMRDYIVADPGYIFFEPDYSQSDLWFVAFESGDENLIKNLLSGADMHCLHGSFFFKIEYESFLKRYKDGDPFIADEPTGLRYITKRVVHGKNYNMAGGTLFTLMRRAAVVAAAVALGNTDAPLWDNKRLANFCQFLLNQYDKLYPGLKPWQDREVEQGAANGNKISVAYGRTRLFFGDLRTDKATQREAIAYKGQGGTAGNINRVLRELYYRAPELAGTSLMTQTHDSLLYQIPEDKFHEHAKIILTCMGSSYSISGRSFSVPTDAKCGYIWGKKGLKYSPEVTQAQLVANREKIEVEYEEYLAKKGIKWLDAA